MSTALLSFSSLSPAQRSRAASTFWDEYFGTNPKDFTYEVDAATGQLTGIRTRVQPLERSRGRGKGVTGVRIFVPYPLRLSPQQALGLVRLFCKFE